MYVCGTLLLSRKLNTDAGSAERLARRQPSSYFPQPLSSITLICFVCATMAAQSATASITGPNDQGLQVGNNPGTINYVVHARAGTFLPYLTSRHRMHANMKDSQIDLEPHARTSPSAGTTTLSNVATSLNASKSDAHGQRVAWRS